MKRFLRNSFCGTGLIIASLQLHALPEFGEAADVQGECFKCHATLAAEQTVSNQWSGRLNGYWVSGRFDILASEQLDLGRQLDDQELGALDVYQVEPGEEVIPKIVATDRSGNSSFIIRGMERGGVNVSQSNQLTFTYNYEGNPSTAPWVPQSVIANPSWSFYFTWDDWAGNTSPDGTEIEFPMLIDASTPEDVYLITVGLAISHTTDLAYEEHSFYVQVGNGGLADYWSTYPIVNVGSQKWVDTGSWMSWLEVTKAAGGWVYASSLGSWVYMKEADVTEKGSWGYIRNLQGIGGSASGNDSWASYAIVNVGSQKWVDTGSWMGWLEVSKAATGWIYSSSLDAWIYMNEGQVTASGAWGYIRK